MGTPAKSLLFTGVRAVSNVFAKRRRSRKRKSVAARPQPPLRPWACALLWVFKGLHLSDANRLSVNINDQPMLNKYGFLGTHFSDRAA